MFRWKLTFCNLSIRSRSLNIRRRKIGKDQRKRFKCLLAIQTLNVLGLCWFVETLYMMVYEYSLNLEYRNTTFTLHHGQIQQPVNDTLIVPKTVWMTKVISAAKCHQSVNFRSSEVCCFNTFCHCRVEHFVQILKGSLVHSRHINTEYVKCQ